MHVFVINLARRHDRLVSAVNALRRARFTDIEQWDAIDSRSKALQVTYADISAPKSTPAETACTLSHYSLLRHLNEHHELFGTEDAVLIVEDDVSFVDDFTSGTLSELLKNRSPATFDILFLGYCGTNELSNFFEWVRTRVRREKSLSVCRNTTGVLCAHAYVISRYGIQRIIDFMEAARWTAPVDDRYAQYCSLPGSWCVLPVSRDWQTIRRGVARQNDNLGTDVQRSI